jgi:hypothetical protein
MRTAPMPFHAWKSQQIAADSAANGGVRTYREREWYWAAYGRYCTSVRRRA